MSDLRGTNMIEAEAGRTQRVVTVRMPAELHARLRKVVAQAAVKDPDLSMNRYVEAIIRQAVILAEQPKP